MMLARPASSSSSSSRTTAYCLLLLLSVSPVAPFGGVHRVCGPHHHHHDHTTLNVPKKALWQQSPGGRRVLLNNNPRSSLHRLKAASSSSSSSRPQPTSSSSNNALLEAWFSSRPVASRVRECTREGCVVEELWGVNDDEPKKTAQSEGDKARVGELVDYMQRELVKLSPSTDEDDYADFIKEGRKMLAISHSCVARGRDAATLEHDVWRTVGTFLADAEPDSGVLVAMPDFVGDATTYLDEEVLAPLAHMGFGPDRVDAISYRVAQGAPFPAFRILVDASDPPED